VSNFGVLVHGRGLVTHFHDEPINDIALAEQVVRSIQLMYPGMRCTIEQIQAEVSVDCKVPDTRPNVFEGQEDD
jgi:hypothetical protein